MEKISSWRLLLGMILAPPLLALVWSASRGVTSLYGDQYLLVFALYLITAYPDFVFHLALCYLILFRTRFRHLSGFCLVMAAVSLAIFAGLHFYDLHGINGLGYGSVTVLKDGHITNEGAVYLGRKAFFNSVAHVVAACFFWIVAVVQWKK